LIEPLSATASFLERALNIHGDVPRIFTDSNQSVRREKKRTFEIQ
jgi:transposase-like protein